MIIGNINYINYPLILYSISGIDMPSKILGYNYNIQEDV